MKTIVPSRTSQITLCRESMAAARMPTIWLGLAPVCNLLKGPETAAIDPSTGRAARLFDPRRDFWAGHFRLRDGRIEGRTTEGRVTELLLQFNRDDLVELRNTLVASGRYP